MLNTNSFLEVSSDFISEFVNIRNDISNSKSASTVNEKVFEERFESIGICRVFNVIRLCVYGDENNELDKEFWTLFLRSIGFPLSSKSFSIVSSVSEGLEFTKSNIEKVLSSVNKEENNKEIIEEGKSLFSQCISGKTIILNNILYYNGYSFCYYGGAFERIKTVERYVYAVLGFPMVSAWEEIVRSMTSKNNTIDFGGFKFKGFKNGNVKITVNDSEVMEKLTNF